MGRWLLWQQWFLVCCIGGNYIFPTAILSFCQELKCKKYPFYSQDKKKFRGKWQDLSILPYWVSQPFSMHHSKDSVWSIINECFWIITTLMKHLQVVTPSAPLFNLPCELNGRTRVKEWWGKPLQTSVDSSIKFLKVNLDNLCNMEIFKQERNLILHLHKISKRNQ